jgi:VWFA-related protein
MTLHVYANLVQVPTLVLDSSFQPLPPIPSQQFSIRLDSGPAFHPTSMRREGDDPLNLAILMDASGDQERLLGSFGDALAHMSERSLHPQDHVSIFAVDCNLVRSSNDIAASALPLRAGVAAVLSAEDLHSGKGKPSCRKSLRLWDAVANVIQDMSRLTGRRALLLVTSGLDRKSAAQFAAVKLYANNNGVAIFGLRDLLYYRPDNATLFSRFGGDSTSRNMEDPNFPSVDLSPKDSTTDLYTELCEDTGGLILTIRKEALEPTLERYVSMLRDRYILEFPRPNQATPGNHSIDVSVPTHRAYVTAAGVSVPLPDPKVLADPSTVPANPSPATMGTRNPHP